MARGYCERGLKLPRASVDHPTRLHLLFLRALSGDKTQLSSDLEELQHAYPQEGVLRDWIQTLHELVEQRRLEALREVTVEAMTHRGPVQLPLIRYFHMNSPVDHDVCWDGRSDTFYAFGRLVELGQKPALSRLLKVMIQAPGQRMKVEQLRASLWPESVADPSNRLKVNAHRLRQELRAPKGVMLLPLQREELALASSPLSVFYYRPDQGVTPLK